jgi:hypothetical protein
VTVSKAEAVTRAREPQSRQILTAVNALVRSLGDIDDAGKARAAIARQLARKMDQPGTGATSLALLSRELRSVLGDLVDPSRDHAAASLISEIFRS